MLELPSSLKIARRRDSEERLLESTKEWLEAEKRDPRVHVSDILDPRFAYWSRLYPEPISDRLAPMFMIGKVLHAFVLSAVEGQTGTNWATDEGSQYSKELDIVWSADKVIEGVPCELKTSRSFYEPKSVADLSLYCEQLLCYMAALRSLRGQLWVLYLNSKNPEGKTSPSFRCYEVSVTRQDLDEYVKRIVKARKMLQRALKTKNPKELPLCREFKCGADNCSFWQKCQPPGRYPNKRASWKKGVAC